MPEVRQKFHPLDIIFYTYLKEFSPALSRGDYVTALHVALNMYNMIRPFLTEEEKAKIEIEPWTYDEFEKKFLGFDVFIKHAFHEANELLRYVIAKRFPPSSLTLYWLNRTINTLVSFTLEKASELKKKMTGKSVNIELIAKQIEEELKE